jgi:hypothetical protein
MAPLKFHEGNSSTIVSPRSTRLTVGTLKTMGLGFDGKKQPPRLPVTDATIGALASRLLLAASSLTCKGK